jgi:RNA polymerase sigma-70 factor, ECF subfamily
MADISVAGEWSSVLLRPKEWTVRVVEPERDDQALVIACLEGDKGAFDQIVERHRRSVYQVCFRFTNNHEDASDLAQETFVRAWKGLPNFKGQAALSTWLYRIAVNVSLNRVSVKKPEVDAIEPDRLVDNTGPAPGDKLVREERARAVRRAINALPEKQRATLILRTYQDLSHKEIADILGSSVGAVKANFFHALANLKKILGSEP